MKEIPMDEVRGQWNRRMVYWSENAKSTKQELERLARNAQDSSDSSFNNVLTYRVFKAVASVRRAGSRNCERKFSRWLSKKTWKDVKSASYAITTDIIRELWSPGDCARQKSSYIQFIECWKDSFDVEKRIVFGLFSSSLLHRQGVSAQSCREKFSFALWVLQHRRAWFSFNVIRNIVKYQYLEQLFNANVQYICANSYNIKSIANIIYNRWKEK